MPDNLTPNYTKEELDAAKAELGKMKPEDLLFLKTELSLAQDAISLPEAPAIAFMELRAASGAKINLTVRAGSGQAVLDALALAVAYARDRYGMVTVGQPVSSSPLPITENPPLPIEEERVPLDLTQPQSSMPSPPPFAHSIPQTSIAWAGGPQSTHPTVEITVESVTRERKRDGKGDFLKVRGGKFVKFGVPCYPEHYPPGFDITKMQYGLEFNNIPEIMRFATVTDDKPNRVIAFHS